MQPESTYLKWMFASLAALLLSVAAICWIVDPFSIFEAPRFNGFNRNKPGYVDHLRLTHVYRVQRLQPTCIVLGTSRTGRGLRPDHPTLARDGCYNHALPGMTMYEMRRYMQHAQAVRPLKRVVLALDFRIMNTAPDNSGAFVEQRLAVDANGRPQFNLFSARLPDITASLVSLHALQASATTIRQQAWVRDTLRPDGYWAPLTERYDHATGFVAYTENTSRRFVEALENEAIFERNFDAYRLLLRDAYAAGIDVQMLVSPSHAWHWQTLWVSGLWKRFERMKRLFVQINDEEARRAGRPAFRLWDFSGSYGVALEPPAPSGARMNWFWEPVHYKGALGDVILSRIAGQVDAGSSQQDFGVPLDASTLDAHLAHLRELQRDFAAGHPDEAAQISRIFERISGRTAAN